MPLNNSSCLLVHEARRHLPARPRACEIFHQRLDISDEFLIWLRSRCSTDEFLNETRISELLSLGWAGRKSQIREFYEALGFDGWVAVDSNSRDGSLAMDLNRNLGRDYGFTETFDFVNNNGATEHVFDQRSVFENIHNLCRTGGVMSHKCPTLHVMNIGFYGVSPVIFHDIAQANQYEILDYRIANRWGDTVKIHLDESTPPPGMDFSPTPPPTAASMFEVASAPAESRLPDFISLRDFIAKSPLTDPDNAVSRVYHQLIERARLFRPGNTGEMFIMATFRKTSDDPFRVPYQHIALEDIDSLSFAQPYQNQFAAQGLPLPGSADAR